ncbi:sigma-70 family RNA polymerase sigma factor [Novosphingobium sp. FKTRR1]|uniref:sigma-70 family RNA polymerase sigma factor n=1 Tax=unclassified Novosphingobium TaxID=2644732 RepID=UPI001CF0B3F6|nr:sigma-70 family RNA polymerase sigma factor [Novosphingobium sp. FKTRR1]
MTVDSTNMPDDDFPPHQRVSDAEFHQLLTDSIPHLRAFGRSLCGCRDRADDLVQETLMKAWAARDRYVADSSFRAWTFTILRNHYYGLVRRNRFVGEYDEAVAERILVTSGGQESRIEATDVLRALGTLPAAQREVLVLMAVGNVSYEDIADICGVALGTVKSRIARARATMSAMLENGVMPDNRHNFVLEGEVLDAFFAQLHEVASNYDLTQVAAA